VKGFLGEFKDVAIQTSTALNRLAKLASLMVGIDPPLVNSYRDEYVRVLGSQAIHFRIQFMQECLLSLLETIPQQAETSKTFYLLAHCTEKTAKPSTHADWQKIFKHFGLNLEVISAGCCGMSGNFGHEANNLELSRKVYQLSWAEKIEQLDADFIVATGYSCRSQVKRFADKKIQHPVQAILQHLEKTGLSRFD
jgi:Fe-S oxidoreductase